MFQTKTPGKKFGSAFAGRKYDELHKEGPDDKTPEAKNPFAAKGASKPAVAHESAAHEAKESPEFEQGEQEGAQEGADSVVAEHGPATSVHVTHDHVAKKHHVTSTHKDGHVHESNHADPSAAHAEAAQLGGSASGEQGPPPEGAAAPESDGFSMPSLG